MCGGRAGGRAGGRWRAVGRAASRHLLLLLCDLEEILLHLAEVDRSRAIFVEGRPQLVDLRRRDVDPQFGHRLPKLVAGDDPVVIRVPFAEDVHHARLVGGERRRQRRCHRVGAVEIDGVELDGRSFDGRSVDRRHALKGSGRLGLRQSHSHLLRRRSGRQAGRGAAAATGAGHVDDGVGEYHMV